MEEKPKIKGRFEKGNKLGKGRPIGLRNKATIFCILLGDEKCNAIRDKVYELAIMGDTACLKMLMDRMYPVPKASTVIESEVLKGIRTITDMNNAMTGILDSVGASELSIEEALDLSKLVTDKGLSIQKCNADELDMIRAKMAVQTETRFKPAAMQPSPFAKTDTGVPHK